MSAQDNTLALWQLSRMPYEWVVGDNGAWTFDDFFNLKLNLMVFVKDIASVKPCGRFVL